MAPESDSILGKWVQFERAYSIGGPLIFEEVDGDIVYNILKDNTFLRESDTDVIGRWSTEEREFGDETLMVISFEYEREGENINDDFMYSIESNILQLTPIPFCIEGCYNRFERQ